MKSRKDKDKETVKESGKKKARKLQLPEELSRVNLNTAGIDVGANSHFMTVRAGLCRAATGRGSRRRGTASRAGRIIPASAERWGRCLGSVVKLPRHSGFRRNPRVSVCKAFRGIGPLWIPAFAGMTEIKLSRVWQLNLTTLPRQWPFGPIRSA